MENCADIAIVGAGILGLAHAWAAARRGMRVVVFERGSHAAGASVRNFGLIWPIGQPHGAMHEMVLRSRSTWLEVLDDARLPYWPTGSMHLAYRNDEAAVAREFAERAPKFGYDCAWLKPDEVVARSSAVRCDGLIGGLWSPLEVTVDPRVVLASLPGYLQQRYGVQVRFGCAARGIDLPLIEAGNERWRVERAIICSGDDFESLFPQVYKQSGLTRVKLQMLRTVPQMDGWRLGPALAAGAHTALLPFVPDLRNASRAAPPDCVRDTGV